MKVPSACSWLALLSAAHTAVAAALAHDDPLLNRSAVHARNAACATENKCDGARMARRRANAIQARSSLQSRDARNNPDNVFDSAHWNRLSYQNPNGGSWQQIYDCAYYGYSHHVSSTNGDSVTVYFSGTGFNLIGEARPSGGVGQVWVDDKVVGLYDSYAAYPEKQDTLLTIDGLSDGSHKLVLKNNLIKGGPNGVGGGTTLSFDALEVTRITGEPAWQAIPITAAKRVGSRWGAWVKGDISSALWSTWGANDYASFTWTGTGFRVYTAGKNDGVYANIRLAPGNGSTSDPLVGYLNSWMPDTQLSLNNFAMEDLWPRTYTVSIVNTAKRPDGSGGYLNMDGIRFIDRSSTRQYIGANDPSIVTTGTWSTDASIYGNGKARTTTQAGVQMTLSFTGTGVSVIGERGPESGNYRILIDGNIIDWRINKEANTKAQWTLFQTHSLPYGPHTITVRSNDDSAGRRLRVTHFVVRGGSSGNVNAGGSVVPAATTTSSSTSASSTSTSAPAATTTSTSASTTSTSASSTSTSTSAAPASATPQNAVMFEFTDASGKKTTANLGTSGNQYRKQALGINSNATVVSVSGTTNGTYELVRSGLTSVIGAEVYIFGNSMGNATDKCASLVFGYDQARAATYDANSVGPYNGRPYITKAFSLAAPANGQQDIGLTWIDPDASAVQMKFVWVGDDGVLVALPATTPIAQYQANCAWQFDGKSPFSASSVRAARLFLQL